MIIYYRAMLLTSSGLLFVMVVQLCLLNGWTMNRKLKIKILNLTEKVSLLEREISIFRKG